MYYIIKFPFLNPMKKVTFMFYLVKILNIPVMFRAETKDDKPYLLCKQQSLQGKSLLTLNAVFGSSSRELNFYYCIP